MSPIDEKIEVFEGLVSTVRNKGLYAIPEDVSKFNAVRESLSFYVEQTFKDLPRPSEAKLSVEATKQLIEVAPTPSAASHFLCEAISNLYKKVLQSRIAKDKKDEGTAFSINEYNLKTLEQVTQLNIKRRSEGKIALMPGISRELFVPDWYHDLVNSAS